MLSNRNGMFGVSASDTSCEKNMSNHYYAGAQLQNQTGPELCRNFVVTLVSKPGTGAPGGTAPNRSLR